MNGRSVAPSCEDEVVGQPLNFQFSFSSQIFTHPIFPAGRWQYQSIQISAKIKWSEFFLQSLKLKLTNLHNLYNVIWSSRQATINFYSLIITLISVCLIAFCKIFVCLFGYQEKFELLTSLLHPACWSWFCTSNKKIYL